VVAVVGRPNVGKSTFFNRVVGRRVAIVDDRPGVTRDRNFARADWSGRAFYVVDTGGVIEDSDEPLDRAIRQQALAAVAEADVILFLVDGRAGVHPLDQKLGEVLRKASKPVLVVVNKLDNLPEEMGHHDFWALGLGDPLPVSSISGKGSGDLLDRVVACFPDVPEGGPDEGLIRVAVVGKPNVGKSSFVNRLMGEERVVVSEVPGTTRDPVDTPLRYHDRTLVFVDTAGLRRQSKVSDSLEYYSALRTERVVREADVCVVMVDASDGELHHKDVHITEQAWEPGAGVILLVNKWDLVEKETNTAPHYEKAVRQRYPFLGSVPIVFASALSGQRVRRTLDLVLEVQAERERTVGTPALNNLLEELTRRQPPPHHRGRPVKLKYATQVATSPPTFVLFANFPKAVPAHYIRYLQNGLRDRWPFTGSPVRIRIRGSRDT
jgi:GTPase